MKRPVVVEHNAEATFLYVLRLPDEADSVFDKTSVLSGTMEVPNALGITTLEIQTEWTGPGYTRIKVNAGSLLGATAARILIKIVHDGITYTTDPIQIKMVG